MLTLNFLPVWFALSLLRFSLPSRLTIKFILWIVFFQAEDGIRDVAVTGVQTCALPIWPPGLRLGLLSEAVGPAPLTPLVGRGGAHHIYGRFLRKHHTERTEPGAARKVLARRSEEHTSELQSRLHLVCRLLLEKKKSHAH